MDLDVLFLGTSGSSPTARRGLPATLVRRGGDRLLFDCGEGTQRQLLRSVGLTDLEEIFITHFHADHVLGLPGMLKSFGMRGRQKPLTIYGPRGLKSLYNSLHRVVGHPIFEVHTEELEPNEQLERDGYKIAAFPVDHGGRAFGYALLEDRRPGHLDPELARALGVTPGPDFGRLVAGETVNGVRPEQVMGKARPGRSIVLTGDTAPTEMTRLVAHEADLLIHEATFLDDEADRAADTRHSTARGAAGIAADADVVMLALTHLSPRYGRKQVLKEVAGVFDNVIVPHDFDRIDVPFPERGGPVHITREEDRATQERERAAARVAAGGQGSDKHEEEVSARTGGS